MKCCYTLHHFTVYLIMQHSMQHRPRSNTSTTIKWWFLLPDIKHAQIMMSKQIQTTHYNQPTRSLTRSTTNSSINWATDLNPTPPSTHSYMTWTGIYRDADISKQLEAILYAYTETDHTATQISYGCQLRKKLQSYTPEHPILQAYDNCTNIDWRDLLVFDTQRGVATGLTHSCCAFKVTMIHWILQFAINIAFRCVLHRHGSRGIHC